MSLHESSNRVPTGHTQANPDVGGALLDDEGKEVLITEEMVQEACQACEKQWVIPEKQD
ncbi:PA1571 family protein [Xanthomonas sp. WHRI 1810A]|uniref:PA1571 family protein n=1 Tax=Xanthomonas sp. WHRI 1810A TaxID=3161565 RepID=UPI0032E85E3F